MQMSPLPASPWREVSVDFKQLSSCEYLLVITDDYSRYPVVELVRSTSASTVIPQLDKTFSTFAIPEIVRSVLHSTEENSENTWFQAQKKSPRYGQERMVK